MATKLNPSAPEFVPGSLTESWVSLPTEDEALEVSVLSRKGWVLQSPYSAACATPRA